MLDRYLVPKSQRGHERHRVPDLQLDALKKAGCQKIFYEVAKGAKADRPEWLKLLDEISKGDTLIIWKFDRMGRSLHHLILHRGEVSYR